MFIGFGGEMGERDGGGPHLISEQHHDGVLPGAGGGVLDGEGVVVVADDVEVDVRLGRAHHSGSTLDPDADVP